MISEGDRDLILKGLSDAGLPIWNPLLDRKDRRGVREVLAGIEDFREHLGGKLCITLPDPLGSKVEVHEMDGSLIEDAIAHIKSFAGAE